MYKIVSLAILGTMLTNTVEAGSRFAHLASDTRTKAEATAAEAVAAEREAATAAGAGGAGADAAARAASRARSAHRRAAEIASTMPGAADDLSTRAGSAHRRAGGHVVSAAAREIMEAAAEAEAARDEAAAHSDTGRGGRAQRLDAGAAATARTRAESRLLRAESVERRYPGAAATTGLGIGGGTAIDRARTAAAEAAARAERAAHGAAATDAAMAVDAQLLAAQAAAANTDDKFNAFDAAVLEVAKARAAATTAPTSRAAAAELARARGILVTIAEEAATAAAADIAAISGGMVRDRATIGEANATRNRARVQALGIRLGDLVTGGVGGLGTANANATVDNALASLAPALHQCDTTVAAAHAAGRP